MELKPGTYLSKKLSESIWRNLDWSDVKVIAAKNDLAPNTLKSVLKAERRITENNSNAIMDSMKKAMEGGNILIKETRKDIRTIKKYAA